MLVLEAFHHLVPLHLGKVSVQGIRIIAVLDQGTGNLSALTACTAENDAVNLRIVVHYTFQCSVAVFFVHHITIVLYIVGSAVALTHSNHLGIPHIGFGNLLHLKRQGSREKQHPLLLRQTFQNGIQILLETHIQHLIRLIKDKCMHPAQINSFPPDNIQKSSRCCNYNMRDLFQGLNLRLNARSTIYIHNAQIRKIFGVVPQILGNLLAKLAGWAQNQHLRITAQIMLNNPLQ